MISNVPASVVRSKTHVRQLVADVDVFRAMAAQIEGWLPISMRRVDDGDKTP